MQKNIYTDLALEARELNPALSGGRRGKEEGQGLAVSRIRVTTQGAAEKLGKAMGQYVTLDAPGLVDRPLDLFAAVSKSLAKELEQLWKDLSQDATILVVGLGNPGYHLGFFRSSGGGAGVCDPACNRIPA